MRNFHRLAQGICTAPVLTALMRQPELWNRETYRTTYPDTPFAEADDIWLRYSNPDTRPTTGRVLGNDDSIWFPAAIALPQVKPMVLDLMRAVEAYSLDRVLMTRLKPGCRMLPHSDAESPYASGKDRVRYHVVIQGLPGSLFRCGDETVQMLTGEVWLFNALLEHEVINNSMDDRIHLLVDMTLWPTVV